LLLSMAVTASQTRLVILQVIGFDGFDFNTSFNVIRPLTALAAIYFKNVPHSNGYIY